MLAGQVAQKEKVRGLHKTGRSRMYKRRFRDKWTVGLAHTEFEDIQVKPFC